MTSITKKPDTDQWMSLREMADALYASGMRCNCDLDDWEPEASTGHTHVCRIHRTAITAKYRQYDIIDPAIRATLKLDVKKEQS